MSFFRNIMDNTAVQRETNNPFDMPEIPKPKPKGKLNERSALQINIDESERRDEIQQIQTAQALQIKEMSQQMLRKMHIEAHEQERKIYVARRKAHEQREPQNDPFNGHESRFNADFEHKKLVEQIYGKETRTRFARLFDAPPTNQENISQDSMNRFKSDEKSNGACQQKKREADCDQQRTAPAVIDESKIRENLPLDSNRDLQERDPIKKIFDRVMQSFTDEVIEKEPSTLEQSPGFPSQAPPVLPAAEQENSSVLLDRITGNPISTHIRAQFDWDEESNPSSIHRPIAQSEDPQTKIRGRLAPLPTQTENETEIVKVVIVSKKKEHSGDRQTSPIDVDGREISGEEETPSCTSETDPEKSVEVVFDEEESSSTKKRQERQLSPLPQASNFDSAKLGRPATPLQPQEPELFPLAQGANFDLNENDDTPAVISLTEEEAGRLLDFESRGRDLLERMQNREIGEIIQPMSMSPRPSLLNTLLRRIGSAASVILYVASRPNFSQLF